MMKIKLNKFRVKEGESVNLGKRPTRMEPCYSSKKQYRKMLAKHVKKLSELQRHRNGTRIIKFFLHLSKDEQRKRFIDRIDQPEKNWKFSLADL